MCLYSSFFLPIPLPLKVLSGRGYTFNQQCMEGSHPGGGGLQKREPEPILDRCTIESGWFSIESRCRVSDTSDRGPGLQSASTDGHTVHFLKET